MAGLGLVLAGVIGLSLGLLGGGGSILTVPVLVYVLGFEAKQAIAMSLGIVGTVSLVGSVSHWRQGRVEPRTALRFGVFAMIGAYAGAHLAVLFTGAAQLTIFGVVMLAAALSMLREERSDEDAVAPARRDLRWSTAALVGTGVGVLTGLVGVGGGFLIVPALVLLARLPMKQAIGTSLLVIAMNSAAGLSGYIGSVHVPWGFMGVFTAVAIVGTVIGTHVVGFVSHLALKRAFAILLLGMGGLILYQNRGVLLGMGERSSEAPGTARPPDNEGAGRTTHHTPGGDAR
jgi:uncharacterized membrane protein YfcA